MTKFQVKHQVEYGLEVTQRSTAQSANVLSVRCRFCVAFGREDRVGSKRQKTTNVKFFNHPFLPHHYRQHLSSQHSECWETYQTLTKAEKAEYFDNRTPFSATLSAHFVNDKKELVFAINKPIVDVIIGEMLLIDEIVETNDGATTTNFRSRSLDYFKKPVETMGIDSTFYGVTVKLPTQFEVSYKYVAEGLSFRQTASTMLIAKESLGNTVLGSVNERTVSQHIRLVAALNYYRLSQIMQRSWLFSLAFDGASHMSSDYVDLRVRFYAAGDIHDFHAMLIPLSGQHTGLNIYEHIVKFLDVVCSNWRSKLIGISADGAANMTGRLSGTVTRYCNEVPPHFYRIWCVLHQVDLSCQSGYCTLNVGVWHKGTTSVISHLRRAQTFIAELASTCPKLVTTRWLSMCRLLEWLFKNRVRVVEHYEGINPPHQSQPTDEWWVYAAAVLVITREVSKVVTALQGQKVIMKQQKLALDNLVALLGTILSIRGPSVFDEDDEDFDQLVIVGEFAVHVDEVEAVLNELGGFVIDKLKEVVEKETLLRSIGSTWLIIIDGIYNATPSRDHRNEAIHEDPVPVLPQDLAKCTAPAFHSIVTEQRDRLAVSFTALDFQHLEDEHNALRRRYQREPDLKQALDSLKESAGFKESWAVKQLNSFNSFQTLMEFAGGMATPFPTTAAVESDFSVVRWEKDDGRGSLENFTLEGVLHSKMYESLQNLL